MSREINTEIVRRDFNMMYAYDIKAVTRVIRSEGGWAEYTISDDKTKATAYVEGYDGDVMMWTSLISKPMVKTLEKDIKEMLDMKASTKVKHETWQLQHVVQRVDALDIPDDDRRQVVELLAKATNLLGSIGLRLAKEEATEEYSKQLEFDFVSTHQQENV